MTSLLLAVEAVRRDPSPDTHVALLAALGRSPALVRVVPGGGSLRSTVDGSGLFVTDLDDELHLVDTTSYDTLAADDAFAALLAEPGRTVFPDRDRVAIETADGGIRHVRAPGVSDQPAWRVTSDRGARHIAAGYERESANADHLESTVWYGRPTTRPTALSSWRSTARPSMEGSTTSSWTREVTGSTSQDAMQLPGCGPTTPRPAG